MDFDVKIFENRHRISTFLATISIVLFAFLTYREVLNYDFNGTDILTPTIHSLIHGPGDLFHMLVTPTGNWYFPSIFFRPVSGISYAIDYAIWGLDPFGFHLTDLLLHITVAVLAFFLILELTKRKFVAWLGVIIFLAHPILMENVPSPERRQDILPTLFVIASLLLYAKYCSLHSRRPILLIFSVLTAVFGFLSQEVGFILPLLIFSYILFLPPQEEVVETRLRKALISSAPFIVAATAVFIWRTLVIHGFGGYVDRQLSLLGAVQLFIKIVKDYFLDLFDPGGLAGRLAGPYPGDEAKLISLALIVLVLAVVYVNRHGLLALISAGNRAVSTAAAVLFTFALAALLATVSYPFYAAQVNQLAACERGCGALARGLGAGGGLPADLVVYHARNTLMTFIPSLFLLAIAGLIVIGNRMNLRKELKILVVSDAWGPILFFVIWMLVPLLVYLPTLTYAHREMYIAMVPFSALLSYGLVNSFNASKKYRKNRRGDSHKRQLADHNFAYFALALLLVISLAASSPLFGLPGEWKDSGRMTAMFLGRFAKISKSIPQGSVLHAHNLPHGISAYEKDFNNPKDVNFFFKGAIESWLDVNYPGSNIKVLVDDTVVEEKELLFFPSQMNVDIVHRDGNDFDLILSYDPGIYRN
ncbi:MAG: hypothetical protein ACYC6Z_00920 [Thermoleophilia bacterium]